MSAPARATSAELTRRPTERVKVTRVTGPEGDREAHVRPDDLIVEEPLSIQLDGSLVSTTMRTPGHDHELAVGFCFTEGLFGGAEVLGVRHCSDETTAASVSNVVTVDTGALAPVPTPRLGKGLFASTGSVHAAEAFNSSGAVLLTREDVGRHNAVDKVVGALVLERNALPAIGHGLFVSGRASIEMVQKAWAAGFSTLVSVSAPTALAVDAARRANLVLAGFVRGDGFNVYSPERLP